jgi:probable rRNA maturation factor
MPMRFAKNAPLATTRGVRAHGSRSNVNLTVQYATRARPVPSETNLRKWVEAALHANARLTVRLVGLAEGRALNRE